MNAHTFAKGCRLAVGAVVLLTLANCAPEYQPVKTVGIQNLESHRLSGPTKVHAKGAEDFDRAVLAVTIDVNGRVIKTEVVENSSKSEIGLALAAAKTWSFRPQVFEGRPVQAIGLITIYYHPPVIPPEPLPFPNVDPSEVLIELKRTGCFGLCPDYHVAIDGGGAVKFSATMGRAGSRPKFSSENVLWPGVHQARVEPEAVSALLEKFRKAQFMGLKSEYRAGMTDSSTYELTLHVGGVTKRVVDYVGRAVGMPSTVSELEDAVDALAETERWISGNAGTVALLKAEGFNFKSKSAAILIVESIQIATWPNAKPAVELIRAAMAEGLDLNIALRRGGAPVGSIIAEYAARIGDEGLFYQLSRLGYLKRMSAEQLNAAFLSDMGCNPKIAKELVRAGANPRVSSEGGNALHGLRESWGACAEKPVGRRVEMTRALVSLGVPLEGRDSLGWTPVMGCNDPNIAQVLVDAGANVNARGNKGVAPILSVDDDRVALLLLRAGAKAPREILAAEALKRRWPATLSWLNAQ